MRENKGKDGSAGEIKANLARYLRMAFCCPLFNEKKLVGVLIGRCAAQQSCLCTKSMIFSVALAALSELAFLPMKPSASPSKSSSSRCPPALR